MNDLISRQMLLEYIHGEPVGRLLCDKYNLDGLIEQLPSAEPEIIHCEKCQFSEYDALYDDRYCHYDGKAEVVPDEHFCGYGRERQNG